MTCLKKFFAILSLSMLALACESKRQGNLFPLIAPTCPLAVTSGPTTVPWPPGTAVPASDLPVMEIKFSDSCRQQIATDLIETTKKVIYSSEFRAHVLQSGKMMSRVKGQPEEPSVVLDFYLGLHAKQGGPGPIPALLSRSAKDACSPATADQPGPAVPGVTDLFLCGDRGLIQVADFVLRRWYSGGHTDPTEAKACAINTIAHEFSHLAIRKAQSPTSEQDKTQLCRDSDKDDKHDDLPPTTHFTSYTLGSLAQCTYMQQNKLIESSPDDFSACLNVWGTNFFAVSAACQVYDEMLLFCPLLPPFHPDARRARAPEGSALAPRETGQPPRGVSRPVSEDDPTTSEGLPRRPERYSPRPWGWRQRPERWAPHPRGSARAS